MWGIYGWGVTWGEKAKTPPLLTGFFAVALESDFLTLQKDIRIIHKCEHFQIRFNY
jgi:hypothetical protein